MTTNKNFETTYFSMHNHSMYSFRDGYATPYEYMKRADEIGLKGFAITEHGNVFSHVYFDEIKKDYSTKVVFGEEFYYTEDVTVNNPDRKYYHLLILAKDEQGRIELNKLTRLSRDGFYFKKRIDLNTCKQVDTKHLICSSACLASPLARESDINKCISIIDDFKKIFPYYYLEMQSHNGDEQEKYNKKILNLSTLTNTPFVITTDSHYAIKEDSVYQERWIQIGRQSLNKDTESLDEIYDGCYLQTVEEIHECMDKQIGDDNVNIGLKNTLLILDMIDEVNMPWQDASLPKFKIPDGYSSDYEYLRYLVLDKGWNLRNFNKMNESKKKEYLERLEMELEVINSMGFVGYFLIEWEFVNWAKNNDIRVGEGRGSAVGSCVCYCLNITTLDPIKYNLIFERFLNPERLSLPDIDTDFGERELVINHLIDLYGKENVAQVCNFSYETPLVAVKDAGKILGIPYDECDKLSKLFSSRTWNECMEDNPNLYNDYIKYHELFNIASKISNRVSNVSIHAGGVVIGSKSIDNYTAMDIGAKNKEQMLSLNKKKCQPLGLVKYDILGLSNLNIIKDVKQMVGFDDWEIDINNPEFEHDEKTFDLIQHGKNDAVFQLESIDTSNLIEQIQPKTLEDLADITSLIRPDCAPMRKPYVDSRVNGKDIEYIHPDMEKITGKTFGQTLYQEQTMNITRLFGGRSYAQADIFRKAISSKDKSLIKSESHKIYQEIVDNGYDENVAKSISDMLAKGGGYGFNNCVVGDTIINKGFSLSAGEWVPSVEQMYYLKKNYIFNYGSGLSLNEEKELINNMIVDIRFAGYQNVYKLETFNGKSITCTINHKFPTTNGEKPLSDLIYGDSLFVKNNSDFSCHIEQIKKIESCGFANVYDVEMEHPYHTFVANDGIVTSNSHAMAYSTISMQTAYLKSHYPLQFFTALFKQMVSKGTDGYATLPKYINDAKNNFGISVLPPNINKSSYDFVCDEKTNSILFGLSAIKGLGDNAIDELISLRPYKSTDDFVSKINSISTVVTLVKSGALPIKNKKEFLIKYAKKIFNYTSFKPVTTVTNLKDIKMKYDLDLYDIKDKDKRIELLNNVKEKEHKEKQQKRYIKHMENFEEKYLQDEYMWEFQTLSMFITNDPLKDAYQYISTSFNDIEDNVNGVLICVVTKIKRKKDKNGNIYACVELYTPFGIIESKCWANVLSQYGDFIVKGNTLAVLYKKKEEQAFIIQCKPYKQWLKGREF